jgi:SAM-dependent methyltransferase
VPRIPESGRAPIGPISASCVARTQSPHCDGEPRPARRRPFEPVVATVRSWTRAQLRHAVHLFRYSRQPAITVYESLGSDVFGAFEPGWLNLGLWQGQGDESEAATAPRRMVEAVCAGLRPGGCVLDVGSGLGAQDLVVRELLRPDQLMAVNLSHFQLRAGHEVLTKASATPLVADAIRLPIATGTVHTLISIEAAFHFASRAGFFAEARRVLRPGGSIALTDIVVQRPPRGILEYLAGFWTMRFWGLRRSAIATADDIAAQMDRAGFRDVRIQACGNVVIDPALRVLGERFRRLSSVPRLHQWGARAMIAQWRFLRRRHLLDYILVQAVAANTDSSNAHGHPAAVPAPLVSGPPD